MDSKEITLAFTIKTYKKAIKEYAKRLKDDKTIYDEKTKDSMILMGHVYREGMRDIIQRLIQETTDSVTTRMKYTDQLDNIHRKQFPDDYSE